MNRRLKELFFGFLIGLGNMVPGFSGGTVILILGITESITGSIGKLIAHPKRAINELWAYFVGVIIGILFATYSIAIGLEKIPLIVISLFAGLIGETIFIILDNINKRKMDIKSGISFFLCFFVSIGLCFLDKIGINLSFDNPSIIFIIILFLLSTICGAAMILPAASGSLILLSLGLFAPLITIIKNLINCLIKFDFTGQGLNLLIVLLFFIGCLIGIFFVAKIIHYMLKKNDLIIWYGILGLLTSGLFTIYYNTIKTSIIPRPELFFDHVWLNIILSILMFILGFFGLRYIHKIAKIKSDKKELNYKQHKKCNQAIILAGGRGSRMNSELPKCAVEFLGKPMIIRIVDSCVEAGIENIIVVTGYKKEVIIDLLKDYHNVHIAYQEEQLGTANACMYAFPYLDEEISETIVMFGDMGYVNGDLIKQMKEFHENSDCELNIMTAEFDQTYGYGRIVKDSDGYVLRVVEEAHCTKKELKIKEVNSGIFACNCNILKKYVPLIKKDKYKDEYYITSLAGDLSLKYHVDAIKIVNDYHLIGINDLETLHFLEEIEKKNSCE